MANTTTILIVDDNHVNLKVLADYLRDTGFRALVATDGSRALNTMQHITPDLVLLDVMMPGIDGFETCRRIKQTQAFTDIPVIFMTALTDIQHKIKGFEVGGVDYITKPIERKEMMARINSHLTIRRLQQNLKEQIAELDAFSHTVAHDLKAPLGRIMGFAEVLAEDVDSFSKEALNESLHIIANSSKKMNAIIDALLLLASVRKQETVALQPLNMAALIDEGLARLDLLIKTYQPDIIYPQSWPVSLGYPPWIEEIWVNYLSNAFKYGGTPPRIELGATVQEDGMVSYWVKDNGAGLSEEAQAQLFTPFTRINQAHVQGYGLGLSIVYRIVDKLGGSSGVESRPGKGSTFYFTLKQAPTESPP